MVYYKLVFKKRGEKINGATSDLYVADPIRHFPIESLILTVPKSYGQSNKVTLYDVKEDRADRHHTVARSIFLATSIRPSVDSKYAVNWT